MSTDGKRGQSEAEIPKSIPMRLETILSIVHRVKSFSAMKIHLLITGLGKNIGKMKRS
jgi:hypothetical protein